MVHLTRAAGGIDDERRRDAEHAPVIGQIRLFGAVDLNDLEPALQPAARFGQRRALDGLAGDAIRGREVKDRRNTGAQIFQSAHARLSPGPIQDAPVDDSEGEQPGADDGGRCQQPGEDLRVQRSVPFGRMPGMDPGGGDFAKPGMSRRFSQ